MLKFLLFVSPYNQTEFSVCEKIVKLVVKKKNFVKKENILNFLQCLSLNML